MHIITRITTTDRHLPMLAIDCSCKPQSLTMARLTDDHADVIAHAVRYYLSLMVLTLRCSMEFTEIQVWTDDDKDKLLDLYVNVNSTKFIIN